MRKSNWVLWSESVEVGLGRGVCYVMYMESKGCVGVAVKVREGAELDVNKITK